MATPRLRHGFRLPALALILIAMPAAVSAQPGVPDTTADQYDALITSGQIFDNLGVSIDLINDLDGDGIKDIIAGDPISSLGGPTVGRVVALSSRTGEVIYTIFGPQTEAWFATKIANVGDVNGDGMDDIVVAAQHWDLPGAPNGVNDDRGAVFLYDGVTRQELWMFPNLSPLGGTEVLGRTLSVLGDIDGDGCNDVVAGTIGRLFVISGKTGLELNVEFLGAFVIAAAVGDVNGDGTPDYAAGVCRSDAVGFNLGEVDVFSGADHSLIWQLADVKTARLANALTGADVNGDGFSDIIAANWNFSSAIGPQTGRVVVFDGATGTILYRLDGDPSVLEGGDGFGSVLTNVGDLDGDLCDDFFVFASGNDVGGVNRGRTYLYSGKTGTRIRTWTGMTFPDGVGVGLRVSAVSDFNGDGAPDFIAKISTFDIPAFSRSHIAFFLGAPHCAADLDSNRSVDAADLSALLQSWGLAAASPADLNKDGAVNASDLAQLLGQWGSCILFDVTLP